MKHSVLFIFLALIVSCNSKDEVSLNVLKTNYIGSISYLMYQQNIDSIAEIITYGGYATAKEKDTFNLYVLVNDSIVRRRMKGMWCCDYTNLYDSEGILKYHAIFSDFNSEYKIEYRIDGNTITEIENNRFNDSKSHQYIVENNRFSSKLTKHLVDKDYAETVKYMYNDRGQLIKKHSEAKNHPTGEFGYQVILTNYVWKDELLAESNSKQFYNDGKEFYETIISYDNNGLPLTKSVINNKDTICKSIYKIIK